MSDPDLQQEFTIAVSLGLLTPQQVQAIHTQRDADGGTDMQIALHHGYLSSRQLDWLRVSANPLGVVPGYRIDGFLGRGGVGTVYKATQMRLDRPVAIKTINRAAMRNDLTPKRFEREAKIIGQLRHPNIISAFDFGIHNDQLYLVMEFVDGCDAQKLLESQQPIPESHAWHIAQQVCQALENAQQLGVIHRDIKPGNLILTAPSAGTSTPQNIPFVNVADFGLAKFNDNPLDPAITIDAAVSGTPFYMSPEQIQARDIDHRTDIYSLGATIWHLVTGHPPVTGKGPLDVITAKMKREDQWLQSAPDKISQPGFQLLKKMCCYDRTQRIDSYADINLEIDAILASLNAATEKPTPPPRDDDRHYFATAANVQTLHGPADAEETIDSQTTHDYVVGDLSVDSLATGTETAKDQTVFGSGKRLPISWLIAAAALLAVPLAYLAAPNGQSPAKIPATSTVSDDQANSLPRLTELTGLPIFVFDGQNIDPMQKFSGAWEPASGAEGEAVLAGYGTRNFRCRDANHLPLDFFHFVCGFRHNAADKLGFRLVDGSENTAWEVEASPQQLTLRYDDKQLQFPLQQFNEETNFGYHKFQVESQPGYWRIEVDAKLLGRIQKSTTPSSERSIQVFTEGTGVAHFEQIRFRRFKTSDQ